MCKLTLVKQKNSLVCDNKHSFDYHKKGYINLLLAHQKNSKQPGDNSEMVNSRREFLNAGHYQAFANTIKQLVSFCQILPQQPLDILDSGCGEGFYTQQIKKFINNSRIFGLDISKPAINRAASYKNINWCVASSSRPPFAPESFDLIVSVFSRVDTEAFLTLLKPKGFILYAGPGNQHLDKLKALLYEEVNTYSTDKHHSYFGEHFSLIKEQSLQIPLQLSNKQEVMQLVSMTPHAHRISQAGYERLAAINNFSDIADFRLYLYQKK